MFISNTNYIYSYHSAFLMIRGIQNSEIPFFYLDNYSTTRDPFPMHDILGSHVFHNFYGWKNSAESRHKGHSYVALVYT